MISILIPTRKRRDGFIRAMHSGIETAVDPLSLEFVAYVDDDDDSYREIAKHYDPMVKLVFVKGPRIVLSNMWNKCAEAAHGDILMLGNDDIVFRTHGWDQQVVTEIAKFQDRIVMVHGNDGSGSGMPSGTGGFGTHPFITERWVEILRYFTPPFFSSDFADTWINELANGIGRRRYVPFTIEHMHPLFGKAEIDQTTRDRRKRHAADDVERLYQDLASLRQSDIEKLKAAMRENGPSSF
jgi:hypothetical protein